MRRLRQKYPPGAVAALDFDAGPWADVAAGSGLLSLYLTPAELDAKAR
jgi:hypothetical protein